jgi:hypothetical protein
MASKAEKKRVQAVKDHESKQFRLRHIGVEWIDVHSERSKSMEHITKPDGSPAADDWQDIVITVKDGAGNVFEVTRFSCRYDGMLAEGTATAHLICERSWRAEEGDQVSCPICYYQGHGAGKCERKPL